MFWSNCLQDKVFQLKVVLFQFHMKLYIALAASCSGVGSIIGLLLLQRWFAVEYSSCLISVNLNLYVRCFDSLMSKGPSRGPNNVYVYMNLRTKLRLLQCKTGLSPQVIYY